MKITGNPTSKVFFANNGNTDVHKFSVSEVVQLCHVLQEYSFHAQELGQECMDVFADALEFQDAPVELSWFSFYAGIFSKGEREILRSVKESELRELGFAVKSLYGNYKPFFVKATLILELVENDASAHCLDQNWKDCDAPESGGWFQQFEKRVDKLYSLLMNTGARADFLVAQLKFGVTIV